MSTIEVTEIVEVVEVDGSIEVVEVGIAGPQGIPGPSTFGESFVVNSQVAMLALVADVGAVAIRTDLSKSFILHALPASTLSNWQEILTPTDVVQSVNGETGAVTLTAADIPFVGDPGFSSTNVQDAIFEAEADAEAAAEAAAQALVTEVIVRGYPTYPEAQELIAQMDPTGVVPIDTLLTQCYALQYAPPTAADYPKPVGRVGYKGMTLIMPSGAFRIADPSFFAQLNIRFVGQGSHMNPSNYVNITDYGEDGSRIGDLKGGKGTTFIIDVPSGYKNIVSATYDGNVVTVTTNGPHEFETGEHITVADVTGWLAYAGAAGVAPFVRGQDVGSNQRLPDYNYTGAFFITKVSDTVFTYVPTNRPIGTGGAVNPGEPYNADPNTGVCGYSGFIIEHSENVWFEHIYFQGDPLKQPVDLVYFNETIYLRSYKLDGSIVGTPAISNSFEGFVDCMFGAFRWSTPSTTTRNTNNDGLPYSPTARYGVRRGGATQLNDRSYFDRCRFDYLYCARAFDQIQSIWSYGQFNETQHCSIVLRTASAMMEAHMWNNGIMEAEIQVIGATKVIIEDVRSEGCYGVYGDVRDSGGSLRFRYGHWLPPAQHNAPFATARTDSTTGQIYDAGPGAVSRTYAVTQNGPNGETAVSPASQGTPVNGATSTSCDIRIPPIWRLDTTSYNLYRTKASSHRASTTVLAADLGASDTSMTVVDGSGFTQVPLPNGTVGLTVLVGTESIVVGKHAYGSLNSMSNLVRTAGVFHAAGTVVNIASAAPAPTNSDWYLVAANLQPGVYHDVKPDAALGANPPDPVTAPPYLASLVSQVCASGPLQLSELEIYFSGIPKRAKLYVRGGGLPTAGQDRAGVIIKNCVGLTWADFDIDGYHSTIGIDVDIDTEGILCRTFLAAGEALTSQVMNLGTVPLKLGGIQVTADDGPGGLRELVAQFPTGASWVMATDKPYVPSDIPGLALWLKGDTGVYTDAGITPATNGQAVQQWNDQSGNGHHVSQATSGKRPTLLTNWFNGVSGIAFDGVDDFLSGAQPFSLSPSPTEVTAIVFFDRNPADISTIRMVLDDNGTGNTGLSLASQATVDEVYAGIGVGTANQQPKMLAPGNGPIIAMVTMKNGEPGRLYVDWILKGSTTLNSSVNITQAILYVGANIGVQRFHDRRIGQVLMWPRILTAQELARLQGYFTRTFYSSPLLPERRFPVKVGTSTVSDADFASTPIDGAMAIFRHSGTGKTYWCMRSNGVWVSVEAT